MAQAWDRLHPRLGLATAWLDTTAAAVIEGTLIRLRPCVAASPVTGTPEPLWLWCWLTGPPRRWPWTRFRQGVPAPGLIFDTASECRRPVLGWARPKLRDPAAADQWTWIIIACHVQLRLARPSAADLRLPWERPAPPRRADPGPGPPRVPEHPRDPALSGRCAQTRRPGPDARQGQGTGARHPTTTWERRRKGTHRLRHGANAQVKQQAESRGAMTSSKNRTRPRGRANGEGSIYPYRNIYAAYVWVTTQRGSVSASMCTVQRGI